ncbi:MAG: hypothetical protein ACREJQ_06025 [bacterium]
MITACAGAQKMLAHVLAARRDEGFFLFHGPAGVDLESSALNFFKAAVCRQRDSRPAGEFCGECLPCREIGKRIFPDLAILKLREDKSEISIEEFEPIGKTILRIPHYGKRCLLVLHAEDLSDPAKTTALKILEEPKENTLIVFIAHHPWMLPPTLLSRAFKVDHRPAISPEAWQSANAIERFWDGQKSLVESRRELFDSVRPVAESFYRLWRGHPTLQSLVAFGEARKKDSIFDDAEALDLFFRMVCALLHDEEVRKLGGDVVLFPIKDEAEREPAESGVPSASRASSKLAQPATDSRSFDKIYEARNLLQGTYVNRRVLFERTFAELLPA